jgi:hypothetical protein
MESNVPAPSGNDKSFGITARQSRIGLRYTGPQIAGGARISGQAEIDFLGGKAAFGNGINMDLVRLRLAFGRLDWNNVAFQAGQDCSVFAPLNPTSLAEFGIPGLSAFGNLWIRTPQLRVELHNDVSDTTRIRFQIATVDPDVGDFALEWRRFLTNWKNQRFADETGDHFNLAVAYTFQPMKQRYLNVTDDKPTLIHKDWNGRRYRLGARIRSAAGLCAIEGAEDCPHHRDSFHLPVLLCQLRCNHPYLRR